MRAYLCLSIIFWPTVILISSYFAFTISEPIQQAISLSRQLLRTKSTALCDCNLWIQAIVCPECWASCPKLAPIERRTQLISVSLEKHLVGQEEAISRIVNTFRLHTYKYPLSLHFVGANGVGKTMASNLISSSLFQFKDRSSLYIRGNSYRSALPSSIERYREELRYAILLYLNRCPEGLVIIDEMETIHRDTISIFEDLLDSTMTTAHTARLQNFEPVTASTQKAVFVFISDFGSENVTEDMSNNQVSKAVYEDIVKSWKSHKQATLIQHVIFFKKCTKKGTLDMIAALANRLSQYPSFSHFKLNFLPHPELFFERVASYIYREVLEHFPHENYRAVQKLFDSEISMAILSWADQNDLSESDEYFEIDLRFSDDRLLVSKRT